MITYKTKGGRLGENIILIYGLFYFCIVNEIPFSEISLNKDYVGKSFFESDAGEKTFIENKEIFQNIWKYFKPKDKIDEIFSNSQKVKVGKNIFNQPISVDKSKNIVLDDYWLMPYNKKIFHLMFKPMSMVERLKKKFSHVDFRRSCGIHVRLGDFVKIQNDEKLLLKYRHKVPQSADFYQKTILEQKNAGIQNFLVFSDDIEQCKENFKGTEFVFMENNLPCEDMMLMAMCKTRTESNGSCFQNVAQMLSD